jgi:glycosyltransferase involved in cell wall biosynthesis
MNKRKPYAGIISMHPAPYRDPTFAALHQRGVIDIQVLTMFGQDDGHPYWNLKEPPYPNVFLGKSLCVRDYMHLHPRILPILMKSKFDAIVVPGHNHLTSQLAILFCLATRTPLIYSADSVLFKAGTVLKDSWRDRLLHFIAKHSAALWVPGNAARTFWGKYDVPSKQIFEGSYCLDAETLKRYADTEIVRRKQIRGSLGIGEDNFVFLFAGRMIPERGLLYLAEAFQQVAQIFGNVFLLLIGKGDGRTSLEKFFQSKGPGNVRMLDPVPIEDISAYYTSVDAYVLPSVSETYSLALAHAAICGLPIIATDHVGAVPDYVLDGETGWIVPSSDSDKLAQAMSTLVSDLHHARSMGKNAQRLAIQRTSQWAAEQLEWAVQLAVNGGINA